MHYTELMREAHDHSKGKVCSHCKEHQPLSEFNKKKDGLQSYCKSCQKEYDHNICPFKKWFKSKKSDAKRKGVEFTIKPTDIPSVNIRETITETRGRKYTSWEAIEYPKVCPVLGVKLDWGMNGRQPNSPSLDRINPNKGYVKGNVMMMSDLANKMKNNATSEQLVKFSRYHLFKNN
mgnify:CR=1 FL=1|tara:strand:- start:9 stop:539 length:531 start_codon:yes stop_codon:yes gene_type:complete